MLKLIAAAVVALVIGFTVRDMAETSGQGPNEAWEARAAEFDDALADNVAVAGAHETLSDTGEQIKEWLLERMNQRPR